MPNTNYDTRPKAAPLFGSDHTEKAKHVQSLAALAAWIFGAAAAAVTGWWVWLIADRWANGVTDASASNETVVGVGVVGLLLWVGTLLLVRTWRRQ